MKPRVRKIIHVDMDAFFASVEMRDFPELRGKALAIGGRPESRGVIATASYEARKFGVRSAIPSARAVRLCPGLILRPPRFAAYKEASQAIRAVFRTYTELVEPLSLDEAYLDVSGCEQHQGSATRIAEAIRADIVVATGLTASAGVAPNKFLAKVASDWRKPNGITVITPAQVGDFVFALPVERIPGVGSKSVPRLHALGASTCGDLQAWSMTQLTETFGRWGARLYHLCRGEDDRPIVTHRIRKQISVERTFARDIGDPEELSAQLDRLWASFLERTRDPSVAPRVRGATVKVRFADFSTTTLDRVGEEFPTWDVFWQLISEALHRGAGQPVRLLGIGVRLNAPAGVTPARKGKSDPRQLWLFDQLDGQGDCQP